MLVHLIRLLIYAVAIEHGGFGEKRRYVNIVQNKILY